MAVPITTSELLTAILAAIQGVGTVTIDPEDPDPPVGPGATWPNWRSRGLAPQTTDGATGKRAWLVPAGREWQLQGLSATFQTSATPGNRQVQVSYNPGENSIVVFRHRFPAAVQAASLTYTYNFAMGQALLMAPYGNLLSVPLPPAILAPASSIILYDAAQVAPMSDSWTNVNLLVLERVIS